MNEQQIIETRNIRLKDDQVLEVGMTQQFIDRLRQHFGLLDVQPVEDEHVRMYVYGAVNTAVVKAEQGIVNAQPPEGIHRPGSRKKDARGGRIGRQARSPRVKKAHQ